MSVTRTALRLATIATAIAASGTFAVAPASADTLPGCTIDLVSSPVQVSVGYKATSPYGAFVCIDSAPGAPGAAQQSIRVDAVATPSFIGQSSAGVGTADYFVGYNTTPTSNISPTLGGSVLTVTIPFTVQVGSFSTSQTTNTNGLIIGSIPLGGCSTGEVCAAAGTPKVDVIVAGMSTGLLTATGPSGGGVNLSGILMAVETGGSSCVLAACVLPGYIQVNPGVGGIYLFGTRYPSATMPPVCVYSPPTGCP